MNSESPKRGAEATAYIALGSNLGDRERTLRSAIAALRQLGTVEATSSFYETAPVGIVEQPDFLNAVVALRTALSPQELMAALLRVEQQQGRDRSTSVPKGPRTLDLDLLSYGDVVMETPTLTLPHPSLAERRFVLVPLTEIAPQWRHPLSGKTAAILLSELSQRSGESSQPLPRLNSSTPSA
ncbi:MAG TPA: 2-amino-4-hydroxy-6-hydroxymethyldihydropteridine diphosphokinase [Acidobacteriaceae bacterium]|nr:2-amino-4-hydroxy-6-hydroxymethyldihydropteridine diphosphokinase [Acidobacteriaceae bacterium]